MFAIVDVETTGGHASGHKMTEIAIVVSDGKNIIKEFSCLLNPQQQIPFNIQSLTGITPEMVRNAPLFSEKAREIFEILGNHIFVAHNVNFDYAFVKSALAECGMDYNPKRLCSVRYARQISPGLRSYSLGNLCKYFDVRNDAAHRAWGDAKATTEILHQLLASDESKLWEKAVKKNSGEFNLPANVPSKEYHQLPDKPGVYYFLNSSGKPIYIGKAVNLKKRVASHFITNKETKRSQAFKREIYHIDYQLTGSELLAILLEDHEIRHHWPIYNRAQKNPKKRFGVFTYQSQSGNYLMGINKITSQQAYIAEFHSQNEALKWVLEKVNTFNLNPAKCGFPNLYHTAGKDYNDHDDNFMEMLRNLENDHQNMIIKTEGRSEGEHGFAYVENGRFCGIGFIPKISEIKHTDDVRDYLQKLRSSITTSAVVNKVISENRYETILLTAAS